MGRIDWTYGKNEISTVSWPGSTKPRFQDRAVRAARHRRAAPRRPGRDNAASGAEARRVAARRGTGSCCSSNPPQRDRRPAAAPRVRRRFLRPVARRGAHHQEGGEDPFSRCPIPHPSPCSTCRPEAMRSSTMPCAGCRRGSSRESSSRRLEGLQRRPGIVGRDGLQRGSAKTHYFRALQRCALNSPR